MSQLSGKIIDAHIHVGLLGDQFPHWGRISPYFQDQIGFKVFLAYARIKPDQVCDRVLREATLRVIQESKVDKVVCLALDPVYSEDGIRQPGKSHLWVDNDYVIDLRREAGDKILLGASVHPYDPNFEDRVKYCVDHGAVLLKWLPSAQSIDLDHPTTAKAMAALAHLGPGGKPLPLLLHCGGEYAIPPADPKGCSRDFLSWSSWDAFWNLLRFGKRWYAPDVKAVNQNLRDAVDSGAIIILAHCGLPYFATGKYGAVLEHSDFDVIRDYLKGNADRPANGGRFFADASSICTPFRKNYFSKIADLPKDYLLFGSDFPTPIFELSNDSDKTLKDLKLVLEGKFEQVLVPEGNLLDVNYRELSKHFRGHPMFTNFGNLCNALGINGEPVT